ncbi:MAG TPA: MBL fold metallo-hydrolase [Stellaceae bacterium]|nr:MBL fold metallo-hydrolase [Stellaceae bacterium]
MAKSFASQADLAPKRQKLDRLGEGVYCLTAEGDPNTGIIIGEDGVMVIDARATPVLARELMAELAKITDKPVKYVVLTHYHAVRVMGASAYNAPHVIASLGTLELIKERGQQDFQSEVQRFPRLFQNVETVPGLTWPNLVFDRELRLFMGKREIRLQHIGRGHTSGDTIVWLPEEKILFSGDLVEEGTTPYCGDAYLGEWPATLERLAAFAPEKLVPGRGDALLNADAASRAIDATQGFLREMRHHVEAGVKAGQGLRQVFDATTRALEPRYGRWVIFEHCQPFNISRCFDEVSGIRHPRIWTAERDLEMWKILQG